MDAGVRKVGKKKEDCFTFKLDLIAKELSRMLSVVQVSPAMN